MPDYTVRVSLERPAIVVGVRSHAYTVEVPELHTYTVETGLDGGGPAPAPPHLLLEDGFDLLLEDGSLLLLE